VTVNQKFAATSVQFHIQKAYIQASAWDFRPCMTARQSLESSSATLSAIVLAAAEPAVPTPKSTKYTPANTPAAVADNRNNTADRAPPTAGPPKRHQQTRNDPCALTVKFFETGSRRSSDQTPLGRSRGPRVATVATVAVTALPRSSL